MPLIRLFCDEECGKTRPPAITDRQVMEGLLIHRFHGPLVCDVKDPSGMTTRYFWHAREWAEIRTCSNCEGKCCFLCRGMGRILQRSWWAPCWVTDMAEAERWIPENGPDVGQREKKR